jgi:hypothetical protein
LHTLPSCVYSFFGGRISACYAVAHPVPRPDAPQALGWRVYRVPEAASMLLGGGMSFYHFNEGNVSIVGSLSLNHFFYKVLSLLRAKIPVPTQSSQANASVGEFIQ